MEFLGHKRRVFDAQGRESHIEKRGNTWTIHWDFNGSHYTGNSQGIKSLKEAKRLILDRTW